jgi:type II secretory pathway pseudopilin PulG
VIPPRNRLRDGASLIEAVIVVGIIAVLVALAVPAIQKGRMAAWRSTSMNNLRQISVAVQELASNTAGRLLPDNGHSSVFAEIIGAGNLPRAKLPFRLGGIDRFEVYSPVLQSPADPSLGAYPFLDHETGFPRGMCSYAYNAEVFLSPKPTLPGTFADGVAYTLLFSEHYARCGPIRESLATDFNHSLLGGSANGPLRRASFADSYYNGEATPQSDNGRAPKVTFQAAPPPHACDPRMPQTPHSSGMLTAFADGSLRPVAPNVTPAAFWAMVTPRGGENIGDW